MFYRKRAACLHMYINELLMFYREQSAFIHFCKNEQYMFYRKRTALINTFVQKRTIHVLS